MQFVFKWTQYDFYYFISEKFFYTNLKKNCRVFKLYHEKCSSFDVVEFIKHHRNARAVPVPFTLRYLETLWWRVAGYYTVQVLKRVLFRLKCIYYSTQDLLQTNVLRREFPVTCLCPCDFYHNSIQECMSIVHQPRPRAPSRWWPVCMLNASGVSVCPRWLTFVSYQTTLWITTYQNYFLNISSYDL